MSEALGPRDLAILEAQAGEAEAADALLGAAIGGDEGEAADGGTFGGGTAGCGGGRHGLHGEPPSMSRRWPGG